MFYNYVFVKRVVIWSCWKISMNCCLSLRVVIFSHVYIWRCRYTESVKPWEEQKRLKNATSVQKSCIFPWHFNILVYNVILVLNLYLLTWLVHLTKGLINLFVVIKCLIWLFLYLYHTDWIMLYIFYLMKGLTDLMHNKPL